MSLLAATVAAIDRDTEHCPAAPDAGMACVAGTPWGIGPDGHGVGDCIRCGRPAWTARVIVPPVPAGSAS